MLDTAIWKELDVEEAAESEGLLSCLGTNIRPEIIWVVLRQAVLFAQEPVKGHRDTPH
jgi:hypothetical protein